MGRALAVDFRTRVYRGQPRTHTHHHLAGLRAGVDRVVLRCGRLSRLVLRGTAAGVCFGIDGVLSSDLARLANSDALALTSDFHVWIGLTADDDVVLDQLDCVVLTVVDFGR